MMLSVPIGRRSRIQICSGVFCIGPLQLFPTQRRIVFDIERTQLQVMFLRRSSYQCVVQPNTMRAPVVAAQQAAFCCDNGVHVEHFEC